MLEQANGLQPIRLPWATYQSKKSMYGVILCCNIALVCLTNMHCHLKYRRPAKATGTGYGA